MQKIELCKLISAIVKTNSINKENNNKSDKLVFVNWFCKN